MKKLLLLTGLFLSLTACEFSSIKLSEESETTTSTDTTDEQPTIDADATVEEMEDGYIITWPAFLGQLVDDVGTTYTLYNGEQSPFVGYADGGGLTYFLQTEVTEPEEGMTVFVVMSLHTAEGRQVAVDYQ